MHIYLIPILHKGVNSITTSLIKQTPKLFFKQIFVMSHLNKNILAIEIKYNLNNLIFFNSAMYKRNPNINISTNFEHNIWSCTKTNVKVLNSTRKKNQQSEATWWKIQGRHHLGIPHTKHKTQHCQLTIAGVSQPKTGFPRPSPGRIPSRVAGVILERRLRDASPATSVQEAYGRPGDVLSARAHCFRAQFVLMRNGCFLYGCLLGVSSFRLLRFSFEFFGVVSFFFNIIYMYTIIVY